MTLPIVFYIFSFVLGAVVGSFLNVCIYRLPTGESVVFPPSRCTSCGTRIRPWDNIPLLSWLILRGSCRACGAKISARYPLVELINGLLCLALFLKFGPTLTFAALFVFCSALVAITFIDLDHQIIPDVISLPGIFLGFGASFLLPWVSWGDSLLGILLGGGSLFLVAVGYEFLTKKEGMGGGDIKLLAMLGAFLGWKAVLPIVFISSLLGTLVGVPMMLAKGADGKLAIPFGPFLAGGAVIWLFWGELLVNWYLQRFL